LTSESDARILVFLFRLRLDGGTMARIVKTNTQPFCNGTHKISRQEDPNKLYWYDEQGNRSEATDSFQGIRCPQE
jgi:CDGSH-type Zn-finger protein